MSLENQINQIIHYTCCNTPKRVTSRRGASPRHCARATQLLSTTCRSSGEPLATLVSDLTGLRFEPQTYRSRDERVTARLTGRWQIFNVFNLLQLSKDFIAYKQCC